MTVAFLVVGTHTLTISPSQGEYNLIVMQTTGSLEPQRHVFEFHQVTITSGGQRQHGLIDLPDISMQGHRWELRPGDSDLVSITLSVEPQDPMTEHRKRHGRNV